MENSKSGIECKMKLTFKCIIIILLLSFSGIVSSQQVSPDNHLSGTKLLPKTEVIGLRDQMIGGMSQYFEKELKLSPLNREIHWRRNYSSTANYLESVSSNRDRFKKITGVVDEREAIQELILNESTSQKAMVAETDAYTVYSVSWQVLEGITGTGLWIEPRTTVLAQMLVVPDADQSL